LYREAKYRRSETEEQGSVIQSKKPSFEIVQTQSESKEMTSSASLIQFTHLSSLSSSFKDSGNQPPSMKKLSLLPSLPVEMAALTFNMFQFRELFIIESVSRTWFRECWRVQTLVDFYPLRFVLDNASFSILTSRLQKARVISVKSCTKLTDLALTSLKHLVLDSLNLNEESYSAYLDVSPVSSFTTLTWLDLRRYYPMRHLTCIQPLTALRHLSIAALNGPELKQNVHH
jgi:hypothetical protein